MGWWTRALVTGASSGIGKAFARGLAAQGSDLVIVARRDTLLEEVASDLARRERVKVEPIRADLTDAGDLSRVEARLGADDKPVDLLVNNAGGGPPGPGSFAGHDRDAVERQAFLNALSVLRLTHAALSAMTDRGHGHVIQVSAGVAFYPIPWGATYAASKAFVNSFSQAVNYELKDTTIGVTTVCPGFTRTAAPARNGFDETNVPSFLWADPEEVVRAALAGAARGRAMVSPGLVNKMAATFGAHFPGVMVRLSRRFRPLSEGGSAGH
ncbi:MAG: SDR family NAD(P)-dependent oxidoreductase [Actinomycetota bacterium]|nr:SDR family NAD(P)-dependent oxidoreductase [Actinomycetota bacterium]